MINRMIDSSTNCCPLTSIFWDVDWSIVCRVTRKKQNENNKLLTEGFGHTCGGEATPSPATAKTSEFTADCRHGGGAANIQTCWGQCGPQRRPLIISIWCVIIFYITTSILLAAGSKDNILLKVKCDTEMVLPAGQWWEWLEVKQLLLTTCCLHSRGEVFEQPKFNSHQHRGELPACSY